MIYALTVCSPVDALRKKEIVYDYAPSLVLHVTEIRGTVEREAQIINDNMAV